jgi:hypothetical protein
LVGAFKRWFVVYICGTGVNTGERYNNHDSTQFHQLLPNPAGKAHRLRQHGWMEKIDSELALFQEGN